MNDETKEILTDREKVWLWVLRKNRTTPVKEITKTFTYRRLYIRWNWRRRDNLWGRFGGGWNWKLGAQWGGRVLILNLLTSSLTIRIKEREINNEAN